MRRPLPPDGHQFLARFSDEVHEIALCLRDRVFKVMPNIHESVYDVGYTVSMVYGSTERQRDAIVYVASYSKHANLGFSQGALLDDPEGVLVGTGARMRHVKFEVASRPEDATALSPSSSAGGRATRPGSSST